MKKRNLISYVAGFLTAAALFGFCVPTLAANIQKQITATYKDIKLYVDGKEVVPKDAGGNVVEPFVSNGTTYLPVRAVGEAFGKEVTWDGTNNSVYIGKAPGEVESPSDINSAISELSSIFSKKSGVQDAKFTTSSSNDKLKAVIEYGSPAAQKDFPNLVVESVDQILYVAEKYNVPVFFIEILYGSGSNPDIYWHSYNTSETYDESKVGDLFIPKNDFSKYDVPYNKVQDALDNIPVATVLTLSAGTYVVGEDIVSGKYDLSATSGNGNLIVYNSSGRLKINEVFGVSAGYTSSYKNADLRDGYKIEIKGSLNVKFTPIG